MISYTDIIQQNCDSVSPVNWWPRFAYHFTDATNAVSIIASGNLYSRGEATSKNLMRNENASRSIIDITSSEITTKVRFYFRPMTPTQFRNEGFKLERSRYDGTNIPVPVFFLFDLEKLLSTPGVQFSEQSQAGYGSEMLQGVDAFSLLNFNRIYSNGSMDDMTKKYRQAEILYPDTLQIDSYIKYILCRNGTEKSTLLNLLRDEQPERLKRFEPIIKVCPNDMFYRNGLYIEEILCSDGKLNIRFSDDNKRLDYHNKYCQEESPLNEDDRIEVEVHFVWYSADEKEVDQFLCQTDIGYIGQNHLTFTGVTQRENGPYLKTTVRFEGKVMAVARNSLMESELL